MDSNKADSSSDELVGSQPPPGYQPDSIRVLAVFLFYSMIMFSLPFVAFFGTRHLLKNVLNIEGFANTAWSVVSTVIVINLIILTYACKGFEEERSEEAEQPKEDSSSGDSKKTN